MSRNRKEKLILSAVIRAYSTNGQNKNFLKNMEATGANWSLTDSTSGDSLQT